MLVHIEFTVLSLLSLFSRSEVKYLFLLSLWLLGLQKVGKFPVNFGNFPGFWGNLPGFLESFRKFSTPLQP